MSVQNRAKIRKSAIIQSSYIPWKGYFDLINEVDDFVLFDDVQYTRRDWRNRNKIKTAHGLCWLTIPVEVKGKFFQKIKETKVADEGIWAENHFQTLKHAYSKAPHWVDYEARIADAYEKASKLDFLSEVNRLFISSICSWLNIDTRLHWSSDFDLADGKNERLISICSQLKASEYISGPAAKDYIEQEKFEQAGISVSWADYSGYQEYPQMYPPFEHGVSILDLLVHTGPEARSYMKSFKND